MTQENIKNNYAAEIAARTGPGMAKVKLEPTVIKFAGKMFFTSKGKGLWKNKGHAKSAFKNDVKSHMYNYLYHSMTYKEKETAVEFLATQAEYVSVKVPEEMLVNLKF